MITSGGEICSPPPTRVRVRTPWSRAAEVTRSGSVGIVGDERRVDLNGSDDAETRTDLRDELVLGERRERVGELALQLERAVERALRVP